MYLEKKVVRELSGEEALRHISHFTFHLADGRPRRGARRGP
jgi:hypothetical protein